MMTDFKGQIIGLEKKLCVFYPIQLPSRHYRWNYENKILLTYLISN
jgi:hypothetical protein